MSLFSDDFNRPNTLIPPWSGINDAQPSIGELYIENEHLVVIVDALETIEIYKEFWSNPIRAIMISEHVRIIQAPSKVGYGASCQFMRVMGELAGGMYTVPPNNHHPVLGVHVTDSLGGHVWKTRYWNAQGNITDVLGPVFTVDPSQYYYVKAYTIINDDPAEPNGEIHLWVDGVKQIELVGIHNSVYGLACEVRTGGRYIAAGATTAILYLDNYLASDVLPYVLHVKSQVDAMSIEGVEVIHEGKKYYTPAHIPVYEGEHLVSVEPYKEV